jgi:hypothetical protein
MLALVRAQGKLRQHAGAKCRSFLTGSTAPIT